MGKKGKRRQRSVGGTGSSGGAGTTKFTAPTPGLEDVIFTWGASVITSSAEDATVAMTLRVALDVASAPVEPVSRRAGRPRAGSQEQGRKREKQLSGRWRRRPRNGCCRAPRQNRAGVQGD